MRTDIITMAKKLGLSKQKTAGGTVTKVGEVILDSSNVNKGIMLVRCWSK